jgi:hypothetical protein
MVTLAALGATASRMLRASLIAWAQRRPKFWRSQLTWASRRLLAHGVAIQLEAEHAVAALEGAFANYESIAALR